MSEDVLHRNLGELDQAIGACRDKRLHTAALILLYSAMDIAGWLDNDDPKAGTRSAFTAWVNKYLLPWRMLYCNATDLYAARCGMVHTLSPESDLAAKGKARKIFYAWGSAKSDYLQQFITECGKQEEALAVHFDDLYHGWRRGMAEFLNEIGEDANRYQRVLDRAAEYFKDVSVDANNYPILKWDQV